MNVTSRKLSVVDGEFAWLVDELTEASIVHDVGRYFECTHVAVLVVPRWEVPSNDPGQLAVDDVVLRLSVRRRLLVDVVGSCMARNPTSFVNSYFDMYTDVFVGTAVIGFMRVRRLMSLKHGYNEFATRFFFLLGIALGPHATSFSVKCGS